MSRGPGKIERAIEAVFNEAPEWAYSVDDLIDRVYPGLNRIEKKHRVSVLRAAHKVLTRMTDWSWFQSESVGGTRVFFNLYDPTSYGAARVKTDGSTRYRSSDPRTPKHWVRTDSYVRAMLSPGGKEYKNIVAPRGVWWKHTQMRIAERDGDTSQGSLALFREQRAFLGEHKFLDDTPAHIAALL